ncbi:gluconolaconase [Paenibacillus sp. LMG 31460]|uniref:Gluconolaconase n=2 Tax=Paenibacillus germinis TaxID=2654979 RepID=A0ABX1Z4S7_9BACL|nr:gluconolaconase [Paenibacillus germinis]
MGKQAILPDDRAFVFFDGIFTNPQLNHPEGIAIDSQGNIWCGGEKGEIYRIDRDGCAIEQIASTGGFTLGIAFDGQGNLFTCDMKYGAVFRLNIRTGYLCRFADGDGICKKMRIPNVPVVDEKNGFLYVSDSFNQHQSGPGIWRFDLQSGKGRLWYDLPLRFANGIALSSNGDALYVAESFGRCVDKIPILANGQPGQKEIITKVDAVPDGLTLDPKGRIYISCYEPSLIYRWSESDGLELLIYDRDAVTLCHPTNCAFRGKDLFVSNLGRWHITRIANVL